MDLKRTKIVSFILRISSPGFSTCGKCGLPWNYCNPKSVKTNESNGTFATCDVCWNNSTLAELFQYYIETYKMQERQSNGMKHTLKHLLECVKKEYNKTHVQKKLKCICERNAEGENISGFCQKHHTDWS